MIGHDLPPGDESRRPRPVPPCAFTPAEHTALARLRRAIETGAYDDDLAPPGSAPDHHVGGARQAVARAGGSAGHPPRHEQTIDGEILIACLNGVGIVAAIVAAALASAAG